MLASQTDWMQFVGRFHPVLVHLPIGFLLLLGTMEGLALLPRFRHLTAVSRTVLVLTLPVAAVGALCGWLLAQGGGYDPELLAWHQWTGIGTAVAALILLLLHWLGHTRVYRGALVATLILMSVAAHFGGTLTHGRGYLTRYAPEPLRSLFGSGADDGASIPPGSDPTAQPVYAAAIQPVLTEYCVTCHGPDKAKGKLRLDSFDAVLKGGDDGPAIVPGDSTNSLLHQRLLLPLEHDDHMPPDGKPQPTAAEVDLLKWWIDAGALTNRSAAELRAPEPVLGTIRARSQSPVPAGAGGG